jgi:NAD(P)H-dependent FMN reductase
MLAAVSQTPNLPPMPSAPVRVLAVSGSLRARSINTAVLAAAQSLAPPGVELELFRGLGELPHFNPDLDREPLPPPVTAWRDAVAHADILLFCTPEYAHGLPGVLKNALDWLVSFEAFPGKPVAIINARPGATFAPAQLRETLSVMDAKLLDAAAITLPLTSNSLDAPALLRHAPTRDLLRHLLTHLARPGSLGCSMEESSIT